MRIKPLVHGKNWEEKTKQNLSASRSERPKLQIAGDFEQRCSRVSAISMAKMVIISVRQGKKVPNTTSELAGLLRRLTPDNISPAPLRIIEGDGIMVGLQHPTASVQIHNQSVALGVILNAGQGWWKVGAPAPDGSYALFRSDKNFIEVLSDIVASRTIWYIHTPDMFIASTSQRAIVYLLQSFDPNEKVYLWMLSSGTLGPAMSWDKRIKPLPGDARLILDRSSWRMSIERKPVIFEHRNMPKAEYKRQLLEAIHESFDRLTIDLDKWYLPLSGGLDSRMILLMLKGRAGLKTITWGEKKALANKRSDAFIARQLAHYYGLENRYFPLDNSEEPPEILLSRFLVAGEGRVDNISGYMDGFKTWKYLFDSGVQGILRGDEAFGCQRATSHTAIRRHMKLITIHDYAKTSPLVKYFGGYENEVPSVLIKRQNETNAAWRDRLYTEFELPSALAALSDLKLAYVEIGNPLLSRRIIERVRELPDHLRTDKVLFKEIVKSLDGRIAFASHVAITRRAAILSKPAMIDTMLDQLGATRMQNLFPNEFIDDLSIALGGQRMRRKTSSFHKTSKIFQRRIAGRVGKDIALDPDPAILTFRAYIVSRMVDMLKEDAKELRNIRKSARSARAH